MYDEDLELDIYKYNCCKYKTQVINDTIDGKVFASLQMSGLPREIMLRISELIKQEYYFYLKYKKSLLFPFIGAENRECKELVMHILQNYEDEDPQKDFVIL